MSDNGGPAFPHPSGEFNDGHGGMTLRDWFAGQALNAAWESRDKGYYEGDDSDMASCAYQIADAMLKERNK